MSRGNHKTGPRRKPGEWVTLARGRTNRQRTHRATMRCPNSAHVIAVNTLVAHMNSCRSPERVDRRRTGGAS
jgi:hypothetical protein